MLPWWAFRAESFSAIPQPRSVWNRNGTHRSVPMVLPPCFSPPQSACCFDSTTDFTKATSRNDTGDTNRGRSTGNTDSLVCTDPYAKWLFVTDNLNIHDIESLVRYHAAHFGIERERGSKGPHGILKSLQSRKAFLTDNCPALDLFTPRSIAVG